MAWMWLRLLGRWPDSLESVSCPYSRDSPSIEFIPQDYLRLPIYQEIQEFGPCTRQWGFREPQTCRRRAQGLLPRTVQGIWGRPVGRNGRKFRVQEVWIPGAGRGFVNVFETICSIRSRIALLGYVWLCCDVGFLGLPFKGFSQWIELKNLPKNTIPDPHQKNYRTERWVLGIIYNHVMRCMTGKMILWLLHFM